MFKLFKKIVIILVIGLFFYYIMSQAKIYEAKELDYGITFSKKQAVSLGLDWSAVYLDILDNLRIKKLRLPAYWDEIESQDGSYNWQDLDWQINEASRRNVEIILAIGGRLPRWPECHFPGWIETFTDKQREDRLLQYIRETVTRYKDNKNIVAWQIENEPFLSHFGKCPKLKRDFLDQEIVLAKSLDERPIIVTDSGELSVWVPAARRADIFGTTMYRDTYSAFLERYVHYPITPSFFRFKKNIASFFAQPDEWIVIELQAEPWAPEPYQNVSQEERERTMNIDKFGEIIEFARQTGFQEFYLWGVEYWYWEKEINNNPEFLQEAKKLF
jgi:hypothetical protein